MSSVHTVGTSGTGHTSGSCGVGGGVSSVNTRGGRGRVCGGSASCASGSGVGVVVGCVGVVLGSAKGILDLVDDGRHDDDVLVVVGKFGYCFGNEKRCLTCREVGLQVI